MNFMATLYNTQTSQLYVCVDFIETLMNYAWVEHLTYPPRPWFSMQQ
jgi:hypothetical protein